MKLFSKLSIIIIVIITLSFLVIFLFVKYAENKYEKDIVKKDIVDFSNTLSYLVKDNLIKRNMSQVRDTLDEISQINDIRIILLDKDRQTMYDTLNKTDNLGDYSLRNEVLSAFSNDIVINERYDSDAKRNALSYSFSITYGENEEILSIFYIFHYISSVNSATNKRLILSYIISLTLSLIIIYLFSKNLVKKIKHISKPLKLTGISNLRLSIDIDTGDEISSLGSEIIHMSLLVKENINLLKLENQKILNIFNMLKDGLCLIDENDRIIFYNRSFKKVIQEDDINNRLYFDIIRNHTVIENMQIIRKDMVDKPFDFEFDNNVYRANLIYTEEQEHIIFIFRNISNDKRLEQTKKDIISNISHELRTPLAAINGFIEIIEADINSGNKEYVEIIKRNTERLINIVNDILVLDEVESSRFVLDYSKVDIKTLISNTIKIFDNKLKEKELKLHFNFADNIDYIAKVDHFKIESVFINLIDNAIKYTENGSITIDLSQKEQYFEIKVSDTGIGIPKSSLDSVFERFYVVDKSRSKRMGGTGLGLSIVKHIVLSHNGSIKIESEVDQGSSFIIEIPIAL